MPNQVDADGFNIDTVDGGGGHVAMFHAVKMCSKSRTGSDESAMAKSEMICYEDCLELVLRLGANPNTQDRRGQTALFLAALGDCVRCVEMMLDSSGIDANVADCQGSTPLWVSAYEGNHRALALIVQAPGVDVNQADQLGRTPLMISAINHGDDEGKCLALLLKAPGIDINKVDEDGCTALALGMNHGRYKTVSKLLEMPRVDANTCERDPSGAQITTLCQAFRYVSEMLGDSAIGQSVGHTDDMARCFVLLLKSRLVSDASMKHAAALVKVNMPSKREIEHAKAEGRNLRAGNRAALLLLPVLEAQLYHIQCSEIFTLRIEKLNTEA